MKTPVWVIPAQLIAFQPFLLCLSHCHPLLSRPRRKLLQLIRLCSKLQPVCWSLWQLVHLANCRPLLMMVSNIPSSDLKVTVEIGKALSNHKAEIYFVLMNTYQTVFGTNDYRHSPYSSVEKCGLDFSGCFCLVDNAAWLHYLCRSLVTVS